MADGRTGPVHSGENLLFLTDEQLRQGIEAMFFAYRGFTADPDRILTGMAYGRAHHRAVHFINRAPGTTVNNLLSILGVTKQSLNRVLRTLIEDGLVESRVGRTLCVKVIVLAATPSIQFIRCGHLQNVHTSDLHIS